MASYLPYKVYNLLVSVRVIRINMDVLYAFIVISFLNRCLNPFIYASQYEVVRRTWTPLIEFLRIRVVRIRQLAAAAAAARMGPIPASLPSQPTHQELPMTTQKLEDNKSLHCKRRSKIFFEVQPQ